MSKNKKALDKHEYKILKEKLGFIKMTVNDRFEINQLLEKIEEQLHIDDVIKYIEKYAPKPIELPEFDLTKKADHVYCIEWGMKKAERNEFEVYQKMLKELKEKYILL